MPKLREKVGQARCTCPAVSGCCGSRGDLSHGRGMDLTNVRASNNCVYARATTHCQFSQARSVGDPSQAQGRFGGQQTQSLFGEAEKVLDAKAGQVHLAESFQRH